MSEHDDYTAGLSGGPRSDSASFRFGEMLRHQREMGAINASIMAPKTVTHEAPGSLYLDQWAGAPGSDTGTFEPRVFDAWDARPGLSFITFLVAVAVFLTYIWPALDAFRAVPETFARIILLGSVCLFLSAWTKALPYISAGGMLLLVAHHMLLG